MQSMFNHQQTLMTNTDHTLVRCGLTRWMTGRSANPIDVSGSNMGMQSLCTHTSNQLRVI